MSRTGQSTVTAGILRVRPALERFYMRECSQCWVTTVSRPIGGVLSTSLRWGDHPSERSTWGVPDLSGERAVRLPRLTLLRVGFTKPPWSPTALVRSYRTVSPLPDPLAGPSAVCSLLHCPSRRRASHFASTLPCGAPTFLTLSGAATRSAHRQCDSPTLE